MAIEVIMTYGKTHGAEITIWGAKISFLTSC